MRGPLPRTAAGVLGLLVADEQKEVHREMIASFATWRAQGTQYSPRRKAIRQLVDTVHYVPSHDSWLIQLADCVAYLFSRYHRIQREKGRDADAVLTPAEAAVVRLWNQHCRERVLQFYLWP